MCNTREKLCTKTSCNKKADWHHPKKYVLRASTTGTSRDKQKIFSTGIVSAEIRAPTILGIPGYNLYSKSTYFVLSTDWLGIYSIICKLPVNFKRKKICCYWNELEKITRLFFSKIWTKSAAAARQWRKRGRPEKNILSRNLRSWVWRPWSSEDGHGAGVQDHQGERHG